MASHIGLSVGVWATWMSHAWESPRVSFPTNAPRPQGEIKAQVKEYFRMSVETINGLLHSDQNVYSVRDSVNPIVTGYSVIKKSGSSQPYCLTHLQPHLGHNAA